MRGGARKGAGRKALPSSLKLTQVSICVDERTRSEINLLRKAGCDMTAEFRSWVHQLCCDLELGNSSEIAD